VSKNRSVLKGPFIPMTISGELSLSSTDVSQIISPITSPTSEGLNSPYRTNCHHVPRVPRLCFGLTETTLQAGKCRPVPVAFCEMRVLLTAASPPDFTQEHRSRRWAPPATRTRLPSSVIGLVPARIAQDSNPWQVRSVFEGWQDQSCRR
jgi:hypothetical protein